MGWGRTAERDLIPMKHLAFTLSLAVAFTASAEPIHEVDPRRAGFTTDGLARLSSTIAAATERRGYLGAVTLIARDGAIVDWRAHGSRDLARREPMKRDAIFRIYSMTKTIATVAALMLVEDGKLALDDPIAKVLPAFDAMRVFIGGTAEAPALRPAATPITLRHLLTHTAGFATGGAGFEEPTRLLERADLHGSRDHADFVRRLARLPLAIDPGKRFAYDGTSLEVVARMIEVASGLSFDAFVTRRVLQPLHMDDTGFTVPVAARHRVVDITMMGADGTLVLERERTATRPGTMLQNYPSAAGGLYSTAPDYLRFCTMLLNGGRSGETMLLRPETVESMMRDQVPDRVVPGNQLIAGETFGLGGSIVVDPSKRGRAGSVGAYGWSGAAATYYTIDRRQRLIAILMLQHVHHADRADLPKIASSFYDAVYGALDR